MTARQLSWALIGTFVVVLVVLSSFFGIGYTTQDDANHFLLFNDGSSLFQRSLEYVKFHSTRPLHLAVMAVPHQFESLMVKELYQAVMIFFSVFSISGAVYLYTGRPELGVLFCCLFFAFLQNGWNHNIVTAYPGTFHSAIASIGIALIALHRYLAKGNRWMLVASSLMYFVAIMISEVHIVYGLLFALAIVKYKENWSDRIKTILPYMAMAALFLLMDFYLRATYEHHYAGTQFGGGNYLDILRTLVFFSVSAVPGFMYVFIEPLYFLYTGGGDYVSPLVWDDIDVLWALKAVLVFLVTGFILKRVKIKLSKSQHFAWLLTLVIFVFLPILPISLTEKYQVWSARYDFHYIFTHHAYFAVVAMLIYVSTAYVSFRENRNIYVVAFSCLFACLSLVTDYANAYVNKSQQLSGQKWVLVDKWLESDYFREMKDGEVVYAPGLWKSINGFMNMTKNYWSSYVEVKTGKKIQIVKKIPRNRRDKKLHFLNTLTNSTSGKGLLVVGNDLQVFKNKYGVAELSVSSLILFSTSMFDNLSLAFLDSDQEEHRFVVDSEKKTTEIFGQESKTLSITSIEVEGYEQD